MKDDLANIGMIVFKLRKFHDNLSLLANKELRKSGITYPQLIMLYFLCQRNGEETAIKDIEKFMQLTHPTVLGIVARLSAKGYIKTKISAKDKRVRLVSIAECPFDIKECGKNLQKAVLAEFKQNFSEQEIETLKKSLSDLIKIIEEI